jgi:hypothetical protein
MQKEIAYNEIKSIRNAFINQANKCSTQLLKEIKEKIRKNSR